MSPKQKIKAPPPVVAEYVGLLRDSTQLLEPQDVPPDACRDPKDRMIFGLIASGRIEAVITGDKDLLVLDRHESARMLSPRAFWDSVRRRK